MSAQTGIEWTDSTWNPTAGCSKAGPECKNCYAMLIAHRFSGPGKPFEGLTRTIGGRGEWNGDLRLVRKALRLPISWVKPRRIFVNSMSDLFHEKVPFEFIADVFAVMSCTTRHTYQILTKRPERMVEFFRWLPDHDFDRDEVIDPLRVFPEWRPQRGNRGGYDNCGPLWPLQNVWLGVSVGEQGGADARRGHFDAVPWPRKFVSYEPAIGPVDFAGWEFVDLIISGGESGHEARPSHPDWHRTTRDFCARHGIAYFFKQWGEWAPKKLQSIGRSLAFPADIMDRVGKKAAGRTLDGREHSEWPA